MATDKPWGYETSAISAHERLALESQGVTLDDAAGVWRAHDGAPLGFDAHPDVRAHLRWLLQYHIHPEAAVPGGPASIGSGQDPGQGSRPTMWAWTADNATVRCLGDQFVGEPEIESADDARAALVAWIAKNEPPQWPCVA